MNGCPMVLLGAEGAKELLFLTKLVQQALFLEIPIKIDTLEASAEKKKLSHLNPVDYWNLFLFYKAVKKVRSRG